MDRLNALREAGYVRRLHTVPHHQPYTVALHSWNMLVLLYELYPATPSSDLVQIVLMHDVPERWIGDVPYPAKVRLAGLVEQQEGMILRELDLPAWNAVNARDREWVRALDILELYLFCLDEQALGNTAIMEVRQTCRGILTEDWVPQQIKDWIDKRPMGRTEGMP